jgi:hypothetical protein
MNLNINEYAYEDSLVAHYRETHPWEVRVSFTGREYTYVTEDMLWMTSARYPGYARIFFRTIDEALLFKLEKE